MTDKEFLESQSRLARRRLHRDSDLLNRDLERALGPLIREYPRTSVATGAAAGLLLGRALAPARRADVAGARRGPIAGTWGFFRDTGVFALRTALARSLLAGLAGGEPPEPPAS